MKNWQNRLYKTLKNDGIKLFSYVPDAGHKILIDNATKDNSVIAIPLTTEEEGIGIAAGSYLGGSKAVLLMQSSGVGNCINMFSLLTNGNFPFVTLVTMRGEFGEFNSWQVPMARATPTSFEMMGIEVMRCNRPDEVGPTVDAALYAAFASEQRIAILLSQRLIGRKEW